MAASGSVIGALRVVLGADTAQFETGLKKGSSELDKFNARAKKVGVALAGAMSLAAAGLGMAIKSTLDEADKLAKMAQSIGVPVEELSALKHAADLSGVSLETLSKGVGRLNRNIVESAQGLQTPTRAFAALGIEIRNTDGQLKTVSQILPELAEKFASMRDGPEKTAIAMQLLGRAGADLIPLLNAGKVGLAAMIAEARELGLVISTETGKAAENFNDNLTRLARVKDGIIIQLTAKLAPALAALSQRLIDAAKNSNLVGNVSEALKRALEGIVRTVKLVYDNMGTLIRVMAVFVGARIASTVIGIGLAFVRFAAAIRLAGLATAAFNVITSVSRKSLLLIAGLVAIATGNFDTLAEKLAELGEKVKVFLPTDVTEKLTSGLKALGVDISALTADMNTLLPAGQAAQGMLNNLGIAIENDTAKRKENALAEQRRQELARAGLQVYEATRTPLELLSEEMARLNLLLQQGVIDFETWQRAAGAAAYNAQQAMTQAGQSLASSFGGAINEAIGFLNMFGSENKAAAIAAIALGKALAIAQVIQMTAAAAMAAVAPPPIGLGPVAGVALAGAIKAMGAVQIGLIAATGIAQAAGVGSNSVSTPRSGSRSSVSRSATEDPASASTAVDRSVHITLKGEMFTREQVRQLVEGINDFVKDGGKLVVT